MITIIRKFLSLAKERKKRLYRAWIFQMLTSICEGAIYFTLFLVLKDILNETFTKESLIRYSLTFLIYTVLHFVFYYVTIASGRPVSYAIIRDERISIAAKIKQFPLHFFTKDKISQLTSLFTTDLSFIEMNIMEIIAGFVSSMVMTVIFALMLFIVDWRMALLLLVGIVPGYLLYQRFQKSMVSCGRQKKEAQVAMIDSTLEYVQGIEAIKAYRLEQSGKLVEKQVDNYCTSSACYESTLTNWNLLYKICLNIGLFLSLSVGIEMIHSGLLAPATYLFFAIMGIIFYRPLEALMGSFAMMNLADTALDNVDKIHNLPSENEKQGSKPYTDRQSEVQFEDVSFCYDGKRKALNHISFRAKPGSITALVGPSGSGKSTILNLIPGFLTSESGRILLNGQDISELNHHDLVGHVSVVFQEIYLFQDTMMNNIRMGNQKATDEQVVAAAKKAHCHEFIEKLPQGYQTVISEGGGSLSGGERQRVAIARAILKDAPIILLDEAFSSLDAENAVVIQKGVEEMIQGKTVFLVSHMLSYIRNADQILVLSDGVLKGCGKHDELMQTVPLYKTMWEKEKSVKNWKLM
ncbi:MAG: ABC transporter ATP-binding protein [Lachnospiraceae bacterium]|nr:ABC transporter ATP-binding protein [Lachnospiraceae bacterium]